MLSPVTGSANVSVCDEISVKDIIGQYSSQYQLDVSRYFENLSRIEIYKCGDSGYRFYHPKSIFGDAAFYEALQKRQGYYSTWNWQHEQAARFLRQGWALMEIGCGLGEFLLRRAKANSCVGLELNPAAVVVARNKGLKVLNETVEAHAEKFSGTYDAVCAFQVFEHVCDVKSFLNAALRCLKPDGLLVLSVPNNHPYVLRYDKMHTLNLPPHHAGLWSRSSLRRLPNFFPMGLVWLGVEPLINVHEYATAIRNHWDATRSPFRFLPRQVVVGVLKVFRRFAEGKDLLAVYRKVGQTQNS